MKTKIILFALLLFVTGCVLSSQNLQGTWKAVESSGNPVREGYTILKHLTPTHFIWTMFDDDGNIVSGAGGTYTLKDGVYTETILYTLPGMKRFKDKKGVYNVKVEGKILSMSGYLENDQDGKIQFSEKWERVE